MKALMLCAGYGTRFLPYTKIYPKCGIPFLNLPLFSYPLFHLKKCGIGQIWMNLHHLPLQMKEIANSMSSDISFSYEKEILNSAGAMKFLYKEFKEEESFLVVNGDSVLIPPEGQTLDLLIQTHKNSNALATLLTVKYPQQSAAKALSVDLQGRVLDFSTTLGDRLEHFTGYYILSSRIFDYIQKDKAHIFEDVLNVALKNNETIKTCYQDDFLWFETGNVIDFLLSTKECVSHLIKPSLYTQTFTSIFKFYNPHIEISNSFIKHPSSELKQEGSGFVLVGQNASFEGSCEGFCSVFDNQKVKRDVSDVVFIKSPNEAFKNEKALILEE